MINLPKPHAPDPLLLTVVEAGRLLSVGRTTVYELIERGELQTVHIGRAVRVPAVAVTDYVERRAPSTAQHRVRTLHLRETSASDRASLRATELTISTEGALT